MMYINFIGANKQPEKLQIHAGIIENYNIIGPCLVIGFKKSVVLDKKPDKTPGFKWAWTKNINDILNYTKVIKFLKTLDFGSTHSKIIKDITKEDNQKTLF